jgi:hypothetical protein
MEADLVGYLVSGGSPDGYQPWVYWDLHVREALEQHAEVLGIVAGSRP